MTGCSPRGRIRRERKNRMKIKKGFVLRDMGGEYVVVAVGEASKTFHGMICLNETGSFLWKQLAENKTEDELADALMQEYEVSREMAVKGVRKFMASLEMAECIED